MSDIRELRASLNADAVPSPPQPGLREKVLGGIFAFLVLVGGWQTLGWIGGLVFGGGSSASSNRSGSPSSTPPRISETEARAMAAKLGMKYTPDTPGIVVTQAEYGSKWPYAKATEAKLRCTRGVEPGTGNRPIATVEVNGFVMGLNGTATGVGGYASDREIRIRNQWGDPVGGSGGQPDFLERALVLCGN